jgi:hypothetical protein
MSRVDEARLVDFCAAQHMAFSRQAWQEAIEVVAKPRDLCAAAWLLASSRWFGHRDQLLEVAGQLSEPGMGAEQTIRASDVDPTRLHALVVAGVRTRGG